jgi:single-stranded-DNA-specific exonuclease
MKVRNIEDTLDTFLDPSYETYRQSPALLNDIDTAIQRIEQAITNDEKIMIFGDYDVDGIMSSYVVYTFFTKFLNYKNISIRLPHRTRDGYGLKTNHIDDIHEQGCTLIITVDNGITSFKEVEYAHELGIDTIITDHHQAIGKVPAALAIVNPQVSPDMPFKDICGAAVAFKLCHGLAEKLITDRNLKKHMYDQLLPFVSIATVADCMPLIHENRLIVKK